MVVADPDHLIQDDVLISKLQSRRYDILNFTSEIDFRNEFEERYHSRWDRREKTHIVVIVYSSEARRQLPYDLEKKSHLIEIGLHQVFPRLNCIWPTWTAATSPPCSQMHLLNQAAEMEIRGIEEQLRALEDKD